MGRQTKWEERVGQLPVEHGVGLWVIVVDCSITQQIVSLPLPALWTNTVWFPIHWRWAWPMNCEQE